MDHLTREQFLFDTFAILMKLAVYATINSLETSAFLKTATSLRLNGLPRRTLINTFMVFPFTIPSLQKLGVALP